MIGEKSIFYCLFVLICFAFSGHKSTHGQNGSRILLPGIESELARKQIAVDFGNTSTALTPLLKKKHFLYMVVSG